MKKRTVESILADIGILVEEARALLPARPKFRGLNPAGLSQHKLKKMPVGCRLLESVEEKKAFERETGMKTDLFVFSRYFHIWRGNNIGDSMDHTYCTSRPRGWWKKGKT